MRQEPQTATRRSGTRGTFFREFLKHPRQIASIVPSSEFVERRVVQAAELHAARTVIELGAGTGGLTRAILDVLPPEGRLLSIEVNPHFCELLGQTPDLRLNVYSGGADELAEAILQYDMQHADAVISGIPFSTLDHDQSLTILNGVASTLAPGGRFVAYQASRKLGKLCRPILGRPRVTVELRNIPPLRVYVWQKD
jgi:phospholipid N-methyltransferase